MSFIFIGLLVYIALAAIYFLVLMAGRKDKTAYIPDPEDLTLKDDSDPFQIWECGLMAFFWLPAIAGALIIGLIWKLAKFIKRK